MKSLTKKEALLQAAKELFGEYGFAETTFKKISDRAGVALGLLTHHYGNKEKLFFAAGMDVLESFISELQQATSEAEDGRNGVLNFCGKVQGFVAHIPDSKFTLTFIPRAVTTIIRGIAELPERIVLLLRKTVFAASQAHRRTPVGNRFTYTLGTMMNTVSKLLNRLFHREKPFRTDFEYVLDASWQEMRKSTGLFTVSVSFGLLLMCAGLFITFLYLLK